MGEGDDVKRALPLDSLAAIRDLTARVTLIEDVLKEMGKALGEALDELSRQKIKKADDELTKLQMMRPTMNVKDSMGF